MSSRTPTIEGCALRALPHRARPWLHIAERLCPSKKVIDKNASGWAIVASFSTKKRESLLATAIIANHPGKLALTLRAHTANERKLAEFEDKTMNAEASRIIVVDNHCGACGTDNVQVYHEHFPELRIMATSSEEGAKRLVASLESSLNAVSDPFHGDPVRQAIADVQAFVNREGAAHPARHL
jgi:hypothetical protein